MSLKVAITGATGFIGRHVLPELVTSGASVVAVTRSPEKAAEAPCPVTTVQLDIGDADDSVFERLGRPDVLIHLAWEGLPNYSAAHHLEQVPHHLAFVEKAVRGGLESVTVAGTCLEYGMQAGELSEDMPCRPVVAYAEAKHALHEKLLELKRNHSFNLTWARLFYAYGDGQAPTSLWTQFHGALERGDGQFDMSPGQQIRDFLPISEMARLLARLALASADAGAVNICSGQPTTVQTLVERWITESGAEISLNLGRYGYPDYEPLEFWGSPAKLRAILEVA